MDLIVSLFVLLVALGLAFWATRTLAAAFGIPPPIIAVIHVLLVVFAVLYVLQLFGLWTGGPALRFR